MLREERVAVDPGTLRLTRQNVVPDARKLGGPSRIKGPPAASLYTVRQYAPYARPAPKGELLSMKNIDPRRLEAMAKKAREASQKRYEEDTGEPSIGASKKRRKELGDVKPVDPRYEGADRLFTEMKKKDRP